MQFFPRNPKFFDMFVTLADKAREAATILTRMHKPRGRSGHARRIETIEHVADTICHRLYREAEATFITPIDREDIHALAQQLDDVVDFIEDVASKLALYDGRGKAPSRFEEFCALIEDASGEIAKLMHLLRGRDKHADQMKQRVIAIHKIEHDGDHLIRHSVSELFTKHKRSPITIIKWKDIYETLEEVLDACEHVADTIDAIVVKNF